ncbi:MAG: glycosyltransferase family 2 protein [Candidatus Omnitrophica bacterium]|nr:glycosyltransferase family 2 protein [Candidatus Omnitrophota bacterium]
MRICVLIPTYNEAKTIGTLVHQVKKYIPDVLVIDDGSSDRTAQLVKHAQGKVIYNLINRGKGAALRQGFQEILREDYEWILTMDGDGQHNPEEIPLFLEKAEGENAVLIIGNRLRPKQKMPVLRWLTNQVMSCLISSMIHQRVFDTQCGYRLIHRELLEKVRLRSRRFEGESELVIQAGRLGFNISSVPIHSIYNGSVSQIRPLRDAFRFLRLLLNLH